MTIKQLSVFIENKQGALLRVLDILKAANVQLIATTLADTADFGICRIICAHPTTAFHQLQEEGVAVTLSEVFAVELDNQPGMAADAISAIAKEGIEITYLYSFLLAGKGILIFRTDQTERAEETLLLNHLKVLTDQTLRALADQPNAGR